MEASSGNAELHIITGYIMNLSNAVRWIFTIEDIGNWKRNLEDAIK
jgi:hypothetical protein